MRQQQFAKYLLAGAVAAGLAACGGGGGSGGGGPKTATGYFVDSAVEGLTYTSGGITDVTDANGKFTYEVGTPVTFKLGGVTIGTATGQGTLTPVDLVAGGTVDNPEVLNIVRFLTLLDENDDPSDGITLSGTVRDMAASWPAVDFGSASFDSDTAMATITSAVGRSLGSLGDAQSHLSGTFYCAASGAYVAPYSVTVQGNTSKGDVVLLVSPTGAITAFRTEDGGDDVLLNPGTLGSDAGRRFSLTEDNLDVGTITYNGSIALDGTVSGTASNSNLPSGVNFSGERFTVDLPADATGNVYQGYYVDPASLGGGVFTIAIDTDTGAITGNGNDGDDTIFDIYGQLNTATGQISLGSTSNGASFSGTLANGIISGTWSDGTDAGRFTGCGRQNGFVLTSEEPAPPQPVEGGGATPGGGNVDVTTSGTTNDMSAGGLSPGSASYSVYFSDTNYFAHWYDEKYALVITVTVSNGVTGVTADRNDGDELYMVNCMTGDCSTTVVLDQTAGSVTFNSLQLVDSATSATMTIDGVLFLPSPPSN